MKHRVPHNLDQDKAKQACNAALDAYKARFSEFKPTAHWVADDHAEVCFNAKGITLKGELKLLPGAVEMDLDVPLVFRFLKKKAVDVVEGEIKQWVAKAERGEI